MIYCIVFDKNVAKGKVVDNGLTTKLNKVASYNFLLPIRVTLYLHKYNPIRCNSYSVKICSFIT